MRNGKIIGDLEHVPEPYVRSSWQTQKRRAMGVKHKSSKRELVKIAEQHRNRT
jgi:hypothetical protein